MPDDDKLPAVRYLQAYRSGIRAAQSIVVVGGGAVGVQMACDLKELYPAKQVTLVHSRAKLMPAYHEALSGLVKARFAELGVGLVTGARAVLPADGQETAAAQREVKLSNGETLTADFVIRATGQTPNTQFLGPLEEKAGTQLVNPQNGFIRVLPTLQFADPKYPHLFAVGDVADTGAHKAARPGALQAAVAAKNVAALVEGNEAAERLEVAGAGIHLTLGLVSCCCCFVDCRVWLKRGRGANLLGIADQERHLQEPGCEGGRDGARYQVEGRVSDSLPISGMASSDIS